MTAPGADSTMITPSSPPSEKGDDLRRTSFPLINEFFRSHSLSGKGNRNVAVFCGSPLK